MNDAAKPTALTAARVTLYFMGGLGYSKIEASSVSLALIAYAQYASAVEVKFVPKGARKERGFVQTFQPSLIVLDGWGHPDPDGIWDESTKREGDGYSTVQAKYRSCDPRWASDFGTKLAGYLESSGAHVLADYRGHNAMRAAA